MTVVDEEATANYVPAAAVIRRWRALSGIIGRKEHVGGFLSLEENAGLNPVWLWILEDLSAGEERGIPSVAVKCVDIGRNTSGEGAFLDCV